MRATGDFSREVDSVLDLSTLPKTRSTTPFEDGVGKDFYVVTFKNKKMDYDTNPSYFVVRPK